MTVSTASARIVHDGNGLTVAFATDFKFLDKTDLRVILHLIASPFTDTLQTLTTHYTVTGAGATTGTVTFVTAPTSAYKVVIYNDTPITQLVDYIEGGIFPAETHEEALDRITIQQLRTRDLVERTPRLADGDIDGSGEYDANGNKIVNLGTPTATTDATTKTYVDALVNNTALGPAPTGLIATGSITSRDLDDRWGEIKNVKDFGAVGNGSTDDTTAIQAAINAAIAAGGGTVFVPGENTYIVKNLTLGSNITFHNEGTLKLANGAGTGNASTTIFNWAATNPTYDANGVPSGWGASNVTIRGGGTFDGNSANAAERFDGDGGAVLWFGHLFHLGGIDGLRIENVTLLDASGFLIGVNQCHNIVIDGCTLLTGAHRGGNSDFNNGRNQDGIHTLNAHSLVISNCYIESSDDCINVDATTSGGAVPNASSRYINIIGNTFAQNMGSANRDTTANAYRVTAYNIKLDPQGTAPIRQVTIVGNVIDGSVNGARAIALGAAQATGYMLTDVICSNNVIRGFTDLGDTGYVPGIFIRVIDIDGLIFSNNIVEDFARKVQFYNAKNIDILNNRFSKMSANATGNPNNILWNLRRDLGPTEDVRFEGNVFDSLLGGILYAATTTSAVTRLSVKNNTIRDCANGNTNNSNVNLYAVVRLAECDDFEFSGNTVYGHAASGVVALLCDSGSKVRIHDNHMVNMGNGDGDLNAECFTVSEAVGTAVNGEVSIQGNIIDGCQGLAVELTNLKKFWVTNNQILNPDQKNDLEAIYVSYSGSSSDLVTTGVEGTIAHNTGYVTGGITRCARIRTEQLNSSTWTGSPIKVFDNRLSGGTTSEVLVQTGTNGDSNFQRVMEENVPIKLVHSFGSTDATPSVLGRNIFKTANAGGTTITDFDDGIAGQSILVIINDANTTVDFTSSGLKGNGGADWSPTTGDHMTCVFDGTDWYCDVSDNTA